MSESAESLREQRRRETTRALADTARRLTTQHGFAGFTVEELCAEVGVSRRTFFNYFESKENAVFGFAVVDPRQEIIEAEFVAADGDLVDDFVDMMARRFDLFNPLDDAEALFAVIEQEPRLLKAAFEQLGKNERRDADLILRRIGDDEENALRAEVMVQTVGALVRLCMDQLLHHHSPDSFRDLLLRRVRIARSSFAPSEKAD
ncbi:TetR/AcrR family transcriptional regulator [Microbacterium sp. NPDC055903]